MRKVLVEWLIWFLPFGLAPSSFGQEITIYISDLTYLDERQRGETEAQPYIWPIFFTIDDEAVLSVLCDMKSAGESLPPELDGEPLLEPLCALGGYSTGNRSFLDAWLRMTNGSHGNVGVNRFLVGATHPIFTNPDLGVTTFTINNERTQDLTRIGLIVVLLEEDLAPPDADIDRAYGTFYGTVRERLIEFVRGSLRRFGSGVGSRPRGRAGYAGPASIDPPHHIVSFYDSDYRLQVAEVTLGRWQTTDLTQLPELRGIRRPARTPHAPQVYWSDGTDHITHVDGGNIWDIWSGPSGWRATEIGSLAHAPHVPASVPFSWSHGDDQFVVFLGGRSAIHLIRSTDLDHWEFVDFSRRETFQGQIGVDNAVGNPMGHSRASDGSPQIFHRYSLAIPPAPGEVGTGLGLLSLSPGRTTWRRDYLPGEGHILSDPFGFEVAGRQYVVFLGEGLTRGEGRNVYQLIHDNADPNVWHSSNLTAGVSADAIAAGNPVVHVIDDARYCVVWRDTRQHIQHLGLSTTNPAKPVLTDITAQKVAPRAASDPDTFSPDARIGGGRGRAVAVDAHYVVYKGEDGHIHSLVSRQTGAFWQHQDITQITAGVPISLDAQVEAFRREITTEISTRLDNAIPDILDGDEVIGSVFFLWDQEDFPSAGMSRTFSQDIGGREGDWRFRVALARGK